MRCFHATQLIALAAACGLAAAQDVRTTQATHLPEPASAARAFLKLEQWVRAFDLPVTEDPASVCAIEGGHAACVILRRSGRVIGVGVDTGADDRMLRRAAGRAMSQVLGDDAVRSIADGTMPDLGEALTIELEIAGVMQPLPGRALAQIAGQLEPGVDGLALRSSDRWSILFPSMMRLTNVGDRAAARLPSMAGEVGVIIDDVNSLPPRSAMSIYEFQTVHLVQTSSNRTPQQLTCGEDEVNLSEATLTGVTAMADGIAQHLLRSMWPLEAPDGLVGEYDKPMGVMGDYQPYIDTVRQPTAPLLDQALTAFALLHYTYTTGVDAETAAQAEDAGWLILRELREQSAEPPDSPDSPNRAVQAAALYALNESSAALPADMAAWKQEMTRSLASGFEAADGPALPGERWSPHARAMVAGSLARALKRGDVDLSVHTVRTALNHAWQSVDEAHQPGLLPWIGWGELDLAAATGEPIEHVDEMLRMRDALTAARATSGLMRGGYALDPSQPGQATAQSTRPLAFLASMLREDGLTPRAERPTALARVLGTMRFVMQLSVRESMRWSLVNPDRAMGGVRASLWDSTQPIAAQAVGLLAACETIQSMQPEAR